MAHYDRKNAVPGGRDVQAATREGMGASRQRADADAHAAYLNTLRWYISGDTNYAECAVRICDAWSAAVNRVPRGTDIPGLSGIPVFDFALAAEVLHLSRLESNELHPVSRHDDELFLPGVS